MKSRGSKRNWGRTRENVVFHLSDDPRQVKKWCGEHSKDCAAGKMDSCNHADRGVMTAPPSGRSDFQASIVFTWASLLVELKEKEENKKVLHLDSFGENAKYWLGVDVLVGTGQVLFGIAGSLAYLALEALMGDYYEEVDIWAALLVFSSICSWLAGFLLRVDLCKSSSRKLKICSLTSSKRFGIPYQTVHVSCSLSTESSTLKSEERNCCFVDALAAAVSCISISETNCSRLCAAVDPTQQQFSSNLKANLSNLKANLYNILTPV
ncbi:serine/threonine-protein kinase PEPKR2 isoform X2 [Canna indica]|uniref:Serine/threonine-protein kinase PEPKR2 isoform X2 n=1 Tax=Canna indica TaxID=4628 RepID=A0AAQ3K8F8_9LILI|nr:serine/threonine-protein kinase PEPKR2 isoform X2 [Canna indica]